MCVCFIYGRNESKSCNCCIVRAPEQILLQPSKAYTVVDSCNVPPAPSPSSIISRSTPGTRVYAMLLKRIPIPGYHEETHQVEAEPLMSTLWKKPDALRYGQKKPS